MNLKKTLLIASLGGAVASGAYAQTETWFFRWSTTGASDVFITTVPTFNTAPTAMYPDGRTLTGVQFSIVPTISQFSGGVQFALPPGAAGSTDVTLSGSPGLSLRFGLLNPIPFSKNVSASSGLTQLPGGASTVVNVNGGLSQTPTSLPLTSVWQLGPFVPIAVQLTGRYTDDSNTPQGTTALNLPILSSGVGLVQYSFTGTVIPEAETYVAGLALAGLVGWTAHRRLRR